MDDDDSILGDIGGRSKVDVSHSNMEEVEEEDSKRAGRESNNGVPSSEESVDSMPLWAGRMKSALMRSGNALSDGDDNAVRSSANAIFRPTRAVTPPRTSPGGSDANILGNQASPSSVKDKFVSSLGLKLSNSFSFSKNDDEVSVSSGLSAKSSTSHRSSTSRKSNSSAASRSQTKRDNALGLTNSYEEEVDEDPAEMIENINSMLSECRVILDTVVDAKPRF